MAGHGAWGVVTARRGGAARLVLAVMLGAATALVMAGERARAEAPLEVRAPTIDQVGVLGADGVRRIDEALVALKGERKVEMSVVVIRTTDGVPVEDWAQATFVKSALGTRGNDDGVLFVLAMDDRRSRLHLGYGVEPWVSDAEAAGILEGIKPMLRAGDVTAAVLAVVEGVRFQTEGYAPGVPVKEPSVPLGARFPGMWVLGTLWALALGIGGTLLVRRYGPKKKPLAAPKKEKGKKAKDVKAALDLALAQPAKATRTAGQPGSAGPRAGQPGSARPSAGPSLALYRGLGWGLWIGGPVVTGLVYSGGGYGFAYGVVALAWMFIGWLWVKRPSGIFGAFFAALAMYFVADVTTGPVTPGDIVEASTIPWGICFVLWFMSFIPAGSGASSGGSYGGSSYYGGSSSGGSSYGGSSSSGSSYSGSSSSGDWGGGGGSSGGGGASSSW